jgi:hypothetical protein
VVPTIDEAVGGSANFYHLARRKNMATALKNRDPEQASASSQANPPDNERAPVQANLPGVEPDRYIVREISFLMDSDGLQFLYKDSRPAQPLLEGTIDPIIPRFTASIPATIGLTGAGLETAETPLDLGVTGGPTYLIFKLDPRLNWRFSRTERAISHKKGEHAQYYGGLRHVAEDGSASEEPIDNCRLVYLVAAPPAGEYRHGFNFNVELIQKPHFGEDEPRILPIMIDPDIRFPGGSET